MATRMVNGPLLLVSGVAVLDEPQAASVNASEATATTPVIIRPKVREFRMDPPR